MLSLGKIYFIGWQQVNRELHNNSELLTPPTAPPPHLRSQIRVEIGTAELGEVLGFFSVLLHHMAQQRGDLGELPSLCRKLYTKSVDFILQREG